MSTTATTQKQLRDEVVRHAAALRKEAATKAGAGFPTPEDPNKVGPVSIPSGTAEPLLPDKGKATNQPAPEQPNTAQAHGTGEDPPPQPGDGNARDAKVKDFQTPLETMRGKAASAAANLTRILSNQKRVSEPPAAPSAQPKAAGSPDDVWSDGVLNLAKLAAALIETDEGAAMVEDFLTKQAADAAAVEMLQNAQTAAHMFKQASAEQAAYDLAVRQRQEAEEARYREFMALPREKQASIIRQQQIIASQLRAVEKSARAWAASQGLSPEDTEARVTLEKMAMAQGVDEAQAGMDPSAEDPSAGMQIPGGEEGGQMDPQSMAELVEALVAQGVIPAEQGEQLLAMLEQEAGSLEQEGEEVKEASAFIGSLVG